MSTASCSRCSAPLSMEAAQGRAPCSACGGVNVPPIVNPYGPQQGWMAGAPQPGAPAWSCPACRHENQGHYEFCLGCGAARRAGAAAHGEGRGYDGNPATSRERSPVALVGLVVGIIVAAVSIGVVAMILAR